ncbi:hypothetical protein B0H14DRAFT_2570015 [Mycena olivaceomarginata]|nr:hypothetical protein B0H14DRAFT_2570015 [Mycena olivaceomarginata]
MPPLLVRDRDIFTLPLSLEWNDNDNRMKLFSEVPGFEVAQFQGNDAAAESSKLAVCNTQSVTGILAAEERFLVSSAIGKCSSPEKQSDEQNQVPATEADQSDDLVNPQGMVLNLSLRGHANTHNLESDIEIASTDKQLDKHEQIPPSSMDLYEMDIDKVITPSEPPRRSRCLTTVVVAKQSSSHMKTPVRKPTKRRSSTSPSQSQLQRGTKKAKAWTETKRNIILNPHLRFECCVTPEIISVVLPDGKTNESFIYFAHPNTRKTEYQLIWDVQKSAAKLSDSSLHSLTLAQWEEMADADRIALWATGCDIYIHGLQAGRPIRNPNQLRRLGQFPDDDTTGEDGVDHTADIRTTTLDTMLEHADDPNGLVLNALGLPGGHFIHPNPLIDTISSGFDLEAKAYCKTNGLPNFETKFPPYEEMGKFWIRSRPHSGCDSDVISDTYSFENWEPERASLETHDYEVTALPAGSGIFLQQPGRRHAVIGTDTEHAPHAATLTIGGYFLCASCIRRWVLNLYLLKQGQTVIAVDRSHEQEDLKGYLPNLSLSSGWLDIIYLACVVELLPCLDHRNYGGPGTPECEVREVSAVCAKYAKWCKWLARTHSCNKIGGKALKWERDIFSYCLLNMALALSQYHGRVALTEPTAEIFHHFTHSTFQSRLRTALRSYNATLVAEFDSQLSTSQRSNFFLFKGNEFIISAPIEVETQCGKVKVPQEEWRDRQRPAVLNPKQLEGPMCEGAATRPEDYPKTGQTVATTAEIKGQGFELWCMKETEEEGKLITGYKAERYVFY